ncbi:hypothetical protein [Salinispora cortesiana]|uniref:hypothetical protein n=1 Tax=Salinispora cortesiana TaxID=1305843 RepID=UPI000411FA8B|nr:hypothetical protein [Salinispora cortesiana]
MTQRTSATPLIRRTAVGSAAFLTAGLLLAGCGVVDKEPSAAPSTPATPKQTLLAAVPDEKTPAFRFSGTETDGTALSGVVDPTNSGMEMVLTMSEDMNGGELSIAMSMRALDQDLWMQVDFGETTELYDLLGVKQKQWVDLDQSKLADDSLTYEIADVGNTGVIIRASDDVQEQADGSYTGTVDLTDDPLATEALFDGDISELGDAAASIPFTAAIGADGNLETLSIELPGVGEQPAGEYMVKYFDYGKAPAITPPTGDVVPAPAEVYELLG